MVARHLPTNNTLILRVVLEIFGFLVLAFPMAYLYLFVKDKSEPFQRGFFCDDNSLKHPMVEEEISTVGSFFIWSGIVIAIVPAVEVLQAATFHSKETKKHKVPMLIMELYRVLGYFTVGAMCTLVITEMAKFKIGRLRPYFLTLCEEDLNDDICKDEHGYMKYVTAVLRCQNASHKEMKEARKSFMSGHSSFSFYCATFLVLYLHSRLQSPRDALYEMKTASRTLKITMRVLRILRPFIQFGLIALAAYIAMTRISDYRHHPNDVLAGMLLGTVVAILFVLYVVNLYAKPKIFLLTNDKQKQKETRKVDVEALSNPNTSDIHASAL